MAQRRSRVSNTPYIYDNTARDLQIRRQMEEPRRQLSHETRKNREKARHMSIGLFSGKLYSDAVRTDHEDHRGIQNGE